MANYIRWLIRRDMPEVLEIERKSFSNPWLEEDFMCCLRERSTIGMIYELNQRVIGFMIYELQRNKINLLNIAVDPDFRRRGVGREFIKSLFGKLSNQRRQELRLVASEQNLVAHIFFRSMRFQAIDVFKDYYGESHDGYEFSYLNEDAFRGLENLCVGK